MLNNKVSSYIARHSLLDVGKLHLVAISGGADSVALLLILQSLGYRLEAVHCNFHLRGEESDRDEAFVQQLCERQHIPLHLAHFDTREYAALHKVSIEMAARDLRYRYFEQLRQDMGVDAICVAHHRDDSVETLLMNLMRGTGIHGLTGIRPVNGHIVRPLLCVSRQEIEEYLHSIGQDFVTDSTNLEDDALRNKIRLHLVPLMQQIIPNSSESIARTALHLAEADRCLDAYLDEQMADLIDTDGDSKDYSLASVSIEALAAQPSPGYFLLKWLTPYGFTPAQISDIATLPSFQTGKEFLSPSHVLLIDRGRLVLASKETAIPSMKIPETGTYRMSDGQRFSFSFSDVVEVSKSADCATIDKESVEFPLTIRTVEPGERFTPYGMKGARLVSDYLTDHKLNLLEKRRQLVVTDACGRIVWLVGHRTDDRFKVTTNTCSILRIERRIH